MELMKIPGWMNNVAGIDGIQTNRSLKPEDHANGFSAGNGV